MSIMPVKPENAEIDDEEDIVIHRTLEYEHPDHTHSILKQLNKLYKGGQFCDATLIVGDHETLVHRAVLASASGLFMDMFMKVATEDRKKDRDQNVFKLKELSWEKFSYLLDFMYTGRLCVPGDHVAAVYKLAQEMRVPAAAAACAEYLIDCLTPDNCLGIRSFASDDSFRKRVDSYINSNIQAVTNSKKFYGLNKVQLEIVGSDDYVVGRTKHDELMPGVLLWLRQKMASQKNKNNMEPLKEDMIVLYLNLENALTDCAEVEDTNLKENGLVQDYKKLNRKKQSGQVQSKQLTPAEQNGNYRKFNINPDKPIVELEWSIVASMKTKDRTYLSIVMLNGRLATLYIHYRSATSAGSASDDPDSDGSSTNLFEKFEESTPLASMATNRCAFGLKAVKGQLFACGGYDRGECLKSSEVYDMNTNKWREVGEMKSPRGRFSIGHANDNVYACGGSSGNSDVKFLESYDSETEKWQIVTEMRHGKASPGIAVLHDKLYVLGGCMGQSTLASCETYDLGNGVWENIAPMHMPRYQIAVTILGGRIYTIGGTNGWKCLNEAEMYDPKTGVWNIIPAMNTARRGAGVDVYKGKIYVVGGNDGVSALNSMEVYDPETRSWSPGPSLNCARANCGVACLDGRLFAVGGFSGKTFMSTMEVLDLDGDNAWSCYVLGPQSPVVTANGDSQDKQWDTKADSDADENVRDLKSEPVDVTKACQSDKKLDIKMEAERTS